jgi:glutathione synthase/RimK-type ligase-like ATP-grasp enzyme
LNPSPEQFSHQTEIAGLAPLLKHAFLGADLTPLANQWIEQARQNRNANTLLDLSLALELLRRREPALAIQRDALRIAQHYRVSTRSANVTLSLLVLKAPGDLSANTPIECLLEDTGIAIELLYVALDHPLPEALPDHDLLFVAIAESRENRPILEYLQHRLASWPRPCLNAPRRILSLERGTACNLLSPISGVVMPHTGSVNRATLRQLAQGEVRIDAVLPRAEFPVIVRPVDSHAGRGLIRVESPAQLIPYLSDRSDTEFFISPFIDYSSADGLFRKYRIVMMQGRPFLCHMGISSHWMVHYPYPEMISSAAHRAEEEQSMIAFDEDFARRHQNALRAIHQRIPLDYLGLDCAENIHGDLVLFEVASAMLVHAMDEPGIFPYKAVQMRKVRAAFRNMLHQYSPADSNTQTYIATKEAATGFSAQGLS